MTFRTTRFLPHVGKIRAQWFQNSTLSAFADMIGLDVNLIDVIDAPDDSIGQYAQRALETIHTLLDHEEHCGICAGGSFMVWTSKNAEYFDKYRGVIADYIDQSEYFAEMSLVDSIRRYTSATDSDIILMTDVVKSYIACTFVEGVACEYHETILETACMLEQIAADCGISE